MGKYGIQQAIAAELRDGATFDLDRELIERAILRAEREGVQPNGEPRIDWYEITEADIAIELGMQRDADIEDSVPSGRPGDWRVLVSFSVVEDSPADLVS